jgi:hypothetical protein
VSLELVYELKSVLILPLADSNEFNLLVADDVKVFKLLVEVSITPNLVLVLLVYEFNEPVVDSIEFSLLF